MKGSPCEQFSPGPASGFCQGASWSRLSFPGSTPGRGINLSMKNKNLKQTRKLTESELESYDGEWELDSQMDELETAIDDIKKSISGHAKMSAVRSALEALGQMRQHYDTHHSLKLFHETRDEEIKQWKESENDLSNELSIKGFSKFMGFQTPVDPVLYNSNKDYRKGIDDAFAHTKSEIERNMNRIVSYWDEDYAL